MKKRFYSIEKRIAAGKFKNSYTVEIITEEILDYEKTRQIFEGVVYYALEAQQKIYSVEFETKKAALDFAENLWCIYGTFAEFENIDFTEKFINGYSEMAFSESYTNETLTIYRNDYCGYVITKNKQNIEEYHNPNRPAEFGEDCWEYIHDEFGYSEEE